MMRVGTSVTEEASLITVEAEVERAGVEPGSGGAGSISIGASF